MPLIELITAAALLQFLAFGIAVGRARGKYGVKAPATHGHEIFDRYYRVQMNTLEQLVIFLPLLWLFALKVNATWAAALGLIYLVGRLIYFFAYVRDPASRSLGFMLTAFPSLFMLIGVLFVSLRSLLSGAA